MFSVADKMALDQESWDVVQPSLGFGHAEFASWDFDYFERYVRVTEM